MKLNEEITEVEKILLNLENLHASFDYLQISLASPKRIRNWCERKLPDGEIIGEVLKPETINFRTHQPEVNGLFCEKIFGPIKNWKCKCGKYNGFVKDKICEDCQVEIIEARVRRYRMGYIDLTCPVTHLWYLKGIPNYLCVLLRCFNSDLKVSEIEQIVYFKEVSSEHPLKQFFYPELNEIKNEFKEFLIKKATNETKFSSISNKNQFLKKPSFKKRYGAEIIKAALESINIKAEIKKSRSFVTNTCLRHLNGFLFSDQTTIRRIRILESFLSTKTNPSWMILTILPVLPPNLRPLVELESGRLVAADVNEIYRLIITRNQRLFDFMYNFLPPDLITIHGRKLLQEGIDSLIDNARLTKEKTLCLNNKALKSLTEILEGKQGRFRQSLLGKRVDYSGRSVIIVGPNLRLNQCGLPYEMAVELFQPFLINELLKTKIKSPSNNTKTAQRIIKKNKPFIWSLLEVLTTKYSVLLNRAPTLHRFGIQAFDPLIVLGQAIHLHPLVCTGFNADFDGDQMAVHLPLYESSQLEARTMMRPSYNVLSPSNGDVILKPTQDMVIGSYYLTLMITKNKFTIQKWFGNEKEALAAFYQKKITIHNPILVRYSMNCFEVFLENNKLKFFDKVTHLNINEKEVIIYKLFQFGKNSEKFYIFTNLGIFIAYWKYKNIYELTDFFLETTPGRLIFSINFKNSIQKY
uniref:DNA-directed RNA polymerase subunit n=1 Tax=Synura uvella TaxID=52557 RepID=A0A3G2QZD6_9STRA|nr:RNA polymerase beta' subunit [Synura uvella]AYO28355.1 RNA polymerase beta' subunit [Synura uvella]